MSQLQKKTLKDIKMCGKTVLVRVDYNVPFYPGTTKISDDSRIAFSIPTIRYLIQQRCKIILCSHIGRPEGKVVENLRMAPIVKRLSEILGINVKYTPYPINQFTKKSVSSLNPGEILMLENLRFNPGEEKNDLSFAMKLASFAEIYVNDAFGTAHRSHASIEKVAQCLPGVTGLLMARELEMLTFTLNSAKKPFVGIIGGAKISDKLSALEHLAPKVDALLLGGGMIATFLKAKNVEVGDSLVELDMIPKVSEFDLSVINKKLDLLLPVDVVVANSFSENAENMVVPVHEIDPGWRIMDIGPKSTKIFQDSISKAKTVFWNGPLGVNEWNSFAQGTETIMKSIANLENATTIIGGGSTAACAMRMNLSNQMTHVSTGGGASIRFIEGKPLPGVSTLLDKNAEITS